MLKRKKNLTKSMSCQFFNKFLGTPSDANAGQRKTKHDLQGSNSNINILAPVVNLVYK